MEDPEPDNTENLNRIHPPPSSLNLEQAQPTGMIPLSWKQQSLKYSEQSDFQQGRSQKYLRENGGLERRCGPPGRLYAEAGE